MRFKINQFLIIAVIIILTAGFAQAQDILPLDQIKPGMEGVAKTVFHGYRVEEFPVKVIDVIKNNGLGDDYILIKAGGSEIEKIGGIAAGMSGSPVYIEGKLVGAIGYGWQLSDHRFGLVTPIKEMLQLLESEKYQTLQFDKLQTPLFVSGLEGRAFNALENDLKRYGVELIPGGVYENKPGVDNDLKPGSAIAVQLARGDVSIASIGTVTYVEGDKILAFGHPFLNRGETDYLLSKAYINGIIPSISQPFKLGSPASKLIGRITADRGAGIAGELHSFPEVIPLHIRVVDRETGFEDLIKVQLIKEERLLTTLTTNIALQAVDNTLDRIGKGTARVKVKIIGSGLPDLEIEKNNIFYSREDIASLALTDLYRLLDLITLNPFKKVNIMSIQLDIEVSNNDNVALVQEARVLNKEVKPGDVLRLEVTLHPYRGQSFTRNISVKIPEDIQPGRTSIAIDGGFTRAQTYGPTPGGEQENEAELNQAQVNGYKDFKSMLEDFMKQPDNNELIIEGYPGYPVAQMPEDEKPESGEGKESGSPEEELPAQGDKGDKDEEESNQPSIKKTVKTDYVLEGSLTLDINIVDKNNRPDADKAPENQVLEK
ncbi:SpoIVB peptidase S55 domain-containing protein [Halothermothrix orenii]|uniref:Peptidase S55 domain-containing protein n=1 Tax=Halothermothrix orenii (strain H 168 / OCM 544 / DSM 9562) TaxID=373903 RepID=B8CZ02_HALOH|nr:SpoIVB peptidase S55 domain-containing protein [Halothermothrix orenii]ACL70521.1 hypothetical protein Hore_17720 [Halothermothrix orenii H 168]